MNNNPIGIFDSGIGGLTVTKEIISELPKESIIYLGDTARVPYGTRSKEVVTEFALQLVNFLLKRNVKVLVVACNTISAHALSEIKKVSPVPVVDVLGPAVQRAVGMTKNKKVGVVGTVGTIGSKAYENAIRLQDPLVEVISVECPLFVPLAEEGLDQHQAAKILAKDYLGKLVDAKIDTLILGCTHYPLLLDTIVWTIGPSVTVIDSAVPTTDELKSLLENKKMLAKNSHPTYEFYVTDAPQRVYRVASRFFGKRLNGRLKKVSLGD